MFTCPRCSAVSHVKEFWVGRKEMFDLQRPWRWSRSCCAWTTWIWGSEEWPTRPGKPWTPTGLDSASHPRTRASCSSTSPAMLWHWTYPCHHQTHSNETQLINPNQFHKHIKTQHAVSVFVFFEGCDTLYNEIWIQNWYTNVVLSKRSD